jgi:hypothetical protein
MARIGASAKKIPKGRDSKISFSAKNSNDMTA